MYFTLNWKEKVQPYFGKKPDRIGFDHTERVYHNALRIAEGMKDVDLDIRQSFRPAPRYSRMKEDEVEGLNHAEDGHLSRKELLEKTEFPKEKWETFKMAIRTHRYSKGLKAENIEGEILQDADRVRCLRGNNDCESIRPRRTR